MKNFFMLRTVFFVLTALTISGTALVLKGNGDKEDSNPKASEVNTLNRSHSGPTLKDKDEETLKKITLKKTHSSDDFNTMAAILLKVIKNYKIAEREKFNKTFDLKVDADCRDTGIKMPA